MSTSRGRDERTVGYDEVFLTHGIPEHPERPERLR
jgi:hypothetical protein